ncbi:MAG TPA: helix-turn-helix domain-containing protein [Bryobacteraceae bacterium]|nr:helix-turn-helix domain-containing protein [Bryobacteraceae bacterium]
MNAPGPDYIAIPYGVFTNSTLTHAAKLLFGRLKLYAGEDGKAFPKHETLAREICVTDRQIRRLLDELKTANLIEWKRTRTSCLFELKTVPDRTQMSDLNPIKTGHTRPIKTGHTRPIEKINRKASIEKNAAAAETVTVEHGQIAAAALPSFENENPGKPALSADTRKGICYACNKLVPTAPPLTPNNPMVDRIWELASSLGATQETLACFLGNRKAVRSWRSHGIVLTLITTELQEFLAQPMPEPERTGPECVLCSDTGVVGCRPRQDWDDLAVGAKFCDCRVGVDKAERFTPVYAVSQFVCNACLSTLRWQSKADERAGKKPQCAFCTHRYAIRRYGWREAFEDPAIVTERLGALTAAKSCELCRDVLTLSSSGIVKENWGSDDASARYCECRWGKVARQVSGDDYPAKLAQSERDWRVQCARFPGKPRVA